MMASQLEEGLNPPPSQAHSDCGMVGQFLWREMALDPTVIFKTSAFRVHTQEPGAEGRGIRRVLLLSQTTQGLTLLMSRGYRVILCMGFSRKLDRGIPLHRGSDANFCKTERPMRKQ